MLRTNQEIIDNKPVGAIFASNNNYYKIGERTADCGGNLPCFLEHYKYDKWYQAEPDTDIRLLSDIDTIISLEKQLKLLNDAVNTDSKEERYTENGEITFNKETGMYTVWDETYSDTICKTQYPKIAEAALSTYSKHYL